MLEQKELNDAIKVIAEQYKVLTQSSLSNYINYMSGDKKKEAEQTAHSLLEGPNSYHQRILRALEDVVAYISEGAEPNHLLDEIQRAAKNCKEIKTPEEFMKRLQSEQTPQAILGFSDKAVEDIYSIGNSRFNDDDFSKASDIFWFVCSLNPTDPNRWMQLGRALQGIDQYANAVYAYSMSALLNPANPMAFFYAAQCSKELGNLKEAGAAITHAIKLAVDDDKWGAAMPELENFKRSLG